MLVPFNSPWQTFLNVLASTLSGVGGMMKTPSRTFEHLSSLLYHRVVLPSLVFFSSSPLLGTLLVGSWASSLLTPLGELSGDL